jgi:hypothetical protein
VTFFEAAGAKIGSSLKPNQKEMQLAQIRETLCSSRLM